MYLAAIEDAAYKEEKISFWDEVYGFDMSAIKNDALNEPLVDVVEDKAVVSDAFAFKEIDIRTVEKSDLTFSVPFELRGTRNDYAHAFLAWFDISFDCCHKPVSFSTGPYAEYTHW
jgi:type I protein arginine methyltransferase